MHLDSREPKLPLRRFMENETRFRMVEKMDPERFERLAERAQTDVAQRYAFYERLAGLKLPPGSSNDAEDGAEQTAPSET